MRHQKEIAYCTFCPKLCRFVCPAGEAVGDESRTPTFRASILFMWEKGELPEELLHRIYSCLLCRACKEVCYHDIDVRLYIVEGRAEINRKGLQPEGSKKVLELMKVHKNPFGRDFKGDKISDVVLFPGCTYLTFYPETVERTRRMLKDAGIEFSTFEGCCGFPLYWMGYLDELKEHTSYLKSKLKGVKKIISMCPHCTWHMREHGFVVEDLLDNLAEFVEKEGKRRMEGDYFYHDPCYRTRYLEEDNSRFILSTIFESPPQNFLFSKRETSCCGGLMMPFVDEELTRAIARMKLEECGDKPLIVSCPHCRKRFDEEKKETYDIIDLIFSSVYG